DRQAIASTTSSIDRPALIDIRYSTLCSPVHNESRSLLIAMLQLAPPTRGSSNTAASRAMAVGSDTVSASTVKSKSPLAHRPAADAARRVARRAAAAPRPMADDHPPQPQRPPPLRDGGCVVGRAVIHDNDLDRPQGLPVQRGDRGAEARAAVERRYDHADRSV